MAKPPIMLLACLFLLWAPDAVSAAPQATKPGDLPEQLPVYIVDFSQDLVRPELVHEIGGLGAFASELIHLRLLEISSMTVHRVQTAPVCGDSLSPVDDQRQVQIGSNTRVRGAPVGDFYIVHGSIETQLPDIVLYYFVDKCQGGQSQKVFQDTQPFTLDHALEEITIAAHAIAFKIERAIPPTQVAVEPFQGEGDLPEQREVQAAARNEVIQAITKSSDYIIANTSDFTIGGKIAYEKNAHFVNLYSNWSRLRADLHVEAGGRRYPLKPITGSRDQLPKFYAEIADEVGRDLPEVLLAEHLQLPDVVENMKADALLAQANQLLDECSDTERECASAQDAVTLLSAAAQQAVQAWKVLLTLGRAQMLAGKNADATLSLEKARSLIKQDNDSGGHISLADQVKAQNLLGDSYRRTEKYDRADAAYDASLRLDPLQPQIYGDEALAFQFNDRRLKALDCLLQGLKTFGQDKSLHQSTKNIIQALRTNEFDQAEESLDQAFRAGVSVSNEYALLTSRKWEEIYQVSWTAETRQNARKALKKALDRQPTDPDVLALVYGDSAQAEFVDGNLLALNAYLDQAERLPIDSVPPSIRGWIKRIRAQDQMENTEYEKAGESADAAYHIQPTDDATYLIANATLSSARCKETAWKLGQQEAGLEQCKEEFLLRDEENMGGVALTPDQVQELKKMYQEAADRTTPLVAKRYQDSDGVFMRANHWLGHDAETQAQFLRLVDRDSKDASAWNILIYVCSQYLFDFDCAFSAAQKYSGLLDPNRATDASNYLNIAEAAVLKGDDETALNWLGIASGPPRPIEPRNASLIYLYRLWVAMRKGQTGEFKTDFESWKNATLLFRAGKDNDLHWVFLGARKALDRSKTAIGESKTELLASMMDALEDNSLTLPTWPESGVL